MFWIGLAVILGVMFELGRYLEKRSETKREKAVSRKEGGNERGKGDKRSTKEAKG